MIVSVAMGIIGGLFALGMIAEAILSINCTK